MEMHHQHPYLNVNPEPGGGGGGGGGGDRDRFPQWSHAETKEFLAIRAELDRSFMETKRNKLLWAAFSAKMKENGFHRTPDQCKCKWKNLVTRYKGSEATEAETNRQFPFQDDMQRIFSERMERLLSFDEGKKGVQVQAWSEDEETNEACDDEEKVSRKKRKVVVGGSSSSNSRSRSKHNTTSEEGVESALREFMRWQMQMEVQRFEASEARETQRREEEMEWRRAMEALARERMMMDKMWRDVEEERRGREEARAERRHALVTALLSKLTNEGL